MKRLLLLLPVLLFLANGLFAQRTCATMDALERLQLTDPDLARRMEAIERHTQEYLQDGRLQQRETIVIPVVVHVVYSFAPENISDAQIQSQIDVLNADFRAMNTDFGRIPALFQGVSGNPDIQFCLADRAPNGTPTNGITRTRGTRRTWGTSDLVKFSNFGGTNAWDASRYLNIWVCNIGNGILGYAQFPGGPAATDGIVVDYRYFGTMGTATPPFDRGRTATHEVGHWLNLRHIWGDAYCGDDFVDDTPQHDRPNYRCPGHPHLSECGDNIVEMTMNYMDYTDDRCMYMFSAGQAARMRAVLAPGGPRASLRNSDGCSSSGGGGNEPPPVTCNVPTGLNATNITTNSARLNWGTVSGAATYDVRFRQTGTSNWTLANTSGTFYNAAGLNDNTSYEFQVRTNCTGASSAYSSSVSFTTETNAPPPPPLATECNDPYEPNNSRFAAKPVPVNAPLKALIDSPFDEDWYRFDNTGAQRNIQIRLTNLPANYAIELYRGSIRVGSSNRPGLEDETISYNSFFITTYFLRVYSPSRVFDREKCYDLEIALSNANFREAESLAVAPTFEVSVFPNPANDYLWLGLPALDDAPVQVQVFDMTGKALFARTEWLSPGDTRRSLDVANLPNGMYIVRVQHGDFTANRKFVISR